MSVSHVREQARIRHRDLYLVRVVQLATGSEQLVQSRMFRFFHVNNRKSIFSVSDVRIGPRHINIVRVSEGNRSAADKASLFGRGDVDDF